MKKTKSNKFKKVVKTIDKYYINTKENLISAGRQFKTGYNNITSGLTDSLSTMNNTSFVRDARKGLSGAVPYIKTEKVHTFNVSGYDKNISELDMKIAVNAFNFYNKKNVKIKKMTKVGNLLFVDFEFEYPITRVQAANAAQLIFNELKGG